jgi:hypothetical protein
VINLNGLPASEALFCSMVLWAFGLWVLYWVIRLAIRHALAEVGVGRLVERTNGNGQPPAEPGADDAQG